MKWKKPLKISEKYQNYHNCTLEVVSNIFTLGLFDTLASQASYLLIFVWPEYKVLIDEMREKRDVIEYNFIQVFAQNGNLNMKIIKDRIGSTPIELFSKDFIFVENNHFSMDFYQEEFILMTSPAEIYSSFEKLMLPFDLTTWICLIITFAVAFFVILLVNQSSIEYQNLIFGARVQTPILNVTRAFLALHKTYCQPTILRESF